jgi:hypothetical protein
LGQVTHALTGKLEHTEAADEALAQRRRTQHLFYDEAFTTPSNDKSSLWGRMALVMLQRPSDRSGGSTQNNKTTTIRKAAY